MKISAENQLSYCIAEHKPCIFWVNTYFKDCLCNLNDELSFAFGLVSLVCWGVAEIPQIITNFHTKSGHGISTSFLLAWVVGDIFNVVGCLLEPATLPTQYYTALLYTTTTIVLLLQSLYYDYFYRFLKKRKLNDSHQPQEEVKKPFIQSNKEADSGIPIPTGGNAIGSRRAQFYYTSARSLAGSSTPPMRAVRSGPSAVGIDEYSSSDDDEDTIANSSNTSTIASRPMPIPRSVSAGSAAFLATALNMPRQTRGLFQGSVGLTGRKLLQNNVSSESYVVGQLLGWMMAAIYMGGRIPQIFLNIKRGSVEGLNPLMFIFALVANLGYVGSILMRTTEWEKIKANLPWLLDAAVCVVLDLFIIMQYIYYRYFRKNGGREEYGDFIDVNKK